MTAAPKDFNKIRAGFMRRASAPNVQHDLGRRRRCPASNSRDVRMISAFSSSVYLPMTVTTKFR